MWENESKCLRLTLDQIFETNARMKVSMNILGSIQDPVFVNLLLPIPILDLVCNMEL